MLVGLTHYFSVRTPSSQTRLDVEPDSTDERMLPPRLAVSVTSSFILDYYLLVFLVSCGVFQMAGAYKGLIGILYLKYRPGSFFLGLALAIGSFTWFFLSEPRNVPDTAQGLNGNEQFAYFFAGSGAALAFTLLLSSLINRKLSAERSEFPAGLDALKHCSYLRALYRTWRIPWPDRPPETTQD